MKYFIYLLIVVATSLILYNATVLNFSNLLEGDSKTALISILASACVIILLLILLVSRAIQQKRGNR
ncbi:hypothetical protein D1818_12305 [Aquimarina sp. BL5]|uniref:hypothetical protein n=1 Tax=Aquimarina sp. BL5 TaxID=1714860 RepID=UPI000E5330BC|nr:hypothetical protein [Aquimarina sp. BL5]AXT51578.1 hypothetical protein D1818_12305 [Aquimarina sp. BL5]RKN09131.1 hypothetical protein D7036_04690 [Aquimarina sp. BL5]